MKKIDATDLALEVLHEQVFGDALKAGILEKADGNKQFAKEIEREAQRVVLKAWVAHGTKKRTKVKKPTLLKERKAV